MGKPPGETVKDYPDLYLWRVRRGRVWVPASSTCQVRAVPASSLPLALRPHPAPDLGPSGCSPRRAPELRRPASRKEAAEFLRFLLSQTQRTVHEARGHQSCSKQLGLRFWQL